MHGVSFTWSHGHPGNPAEYVRTIRNVTYSGVWALEVRTCQVVTEGHRRSSQVTTRHHRSPPVTTGHRRSPQVTGGHQRSPPVTGGHHRSPTVTRGYHRSPQVTTGHHQDPVTPSVEAASRADARIIGKGEERANGFKAIMIPGKCDENVPPPPPPQRSTCC